MTCRQCHPETEDITWTGRVVLCQLHAAAPTLRAFAMQVAGLSDVADIEERAMLAERYASEALVLLAFEQ